MSYQLTAPGYEPAAFDFVGDTVLLMWQEGGHVRRIFLPQAIAFALAGGLVGLLRAQEQQPGPALLRDLLDGPRLDGPDNAQ
jgi:hypothetical protein